jgi:hypothetical protein
MTRAEANANYLAESRKLLVQLRTWLEADGDLFGHNEPGDEAVHFALRLVDELESVAIPSAEAEKWLEPGERLQ